MPILCVKEAEPSYGVRHMYIGFKKIWHKDVPTHIQGGIYRDY